MRLRIQIRHLIPPFLAFLAVIATALAPHIPEFGRDSVRGALLVLPYVLFLLFSFLSLRLNQTNAFLCALILLLPLPVLQHTRASSLFGSGLYYYACLFSLTVPLSLFLVFATTEGPPSSPRQIPRLAIPLLPLAFLPIRFGAPLLIEGLFNLRLMPWFRGWYLPDLGPALMPAIGILLVWKRTIHNQAGAAGAAYFHYSVFWTLFPVLQMLNAAFPQPGNVFGQQLAIGEIFIFAMLFNSLFRVYGMKVYVDELTGIPNRRALNEKLKALGRDYALAMVDIDHFKAFNDTYGHGEGDHVLRWVATHIARESGSQAYRYGGEEFAVVFTGGRAASGMEVMERIRSTLQETEFYVRSPGKRKEISRLRRGRDAEKKVRVNLTISAGVARSGKGAANAEQVLHAADQALYQAKSLGRNRVVEAGAVKKDGAEETDSRA